MKRTYFISLLLALVLLPACSNAATPTITPSPTRSIVAHAAPASPRPTPKEFDLSDLVWMDAPDSSCFSKIGYAAGFEVLAVVFRSNTSNTYLYYNFTSEDWRSFTSAESLGSYYNQNIKGQYSGARLETDG